jgi:hypothetical protein
MSGAPILPTHRRSDSGERGSAYLFVLLILFVLTIVALALVTITQTETQIGGAERSSTRVLYGAESGLQIQFALQRFADSRPRRIILDSGTAAGVLLRERVDVSAQLPLYSGPCALCQVNVGSVQYWAINYVSNAMAVRASMDGAAETAQQATKLISEMFFVQPEQERRIDESVRTFDPDITADDPAIHGLEVVRY